MDWAFHRRNTSIHLINHAFERLIDQTFKHSKNQMINRMMIHSNDHTVD